MLPFRDRRQAGQALGEALRGHVSDESIILALPRGGVPVAYQVAEELGRPLDILMVRKIGDPSNPEFALGAVAEGGIIMVSKQTVKQLGRSIEEVEQAIDLAQRELEERSEVLRGGGEALDFSGRDVVIIDDGLATGSTMAAACEAARKRGAGKITVAVPVSSHSAADRLAESADEILTLYAPDNFAAVGQWYQQFEQTSTDEVKQLLRKQVQSEEKKIDVGEGKTITADLNLPPQPLGLVIFAHGSGSSRHSPRNRMVARYLNDQGLATLLVDLLTDEEERDRVNVFDIPLLGGRVRQVIDWAESELRNLDIGLFGASTGAAAAIVASEANPSVKAIVSRGGRPDLGGASLKSVTAPTLLLVGGNDTQVIDLNRAAREEMICPTAMKIIPGASHLFEEPGTLEEVCRLAGDWFIDNLGD